MSARLRVVLVMLAMIVLGLAFLWIAEPEPWLVWWVGSGLVILAGTALYVLRRSGGESNEEDDA